MLNEENNILYLPTYDHQIKIKLEIHDRDFSQTIQGNKITTSTCALGVFILKTIDPQWVELLNDHFSGLLRENF